jgi:hypothetical protein
LLELVKGEGEHIIAGLLKTSPRKLPRELSLTGQGVNRALETLENLETAA